MKSVHAWPEDSTCPICLEDGAKARPCATCTYKYHPACLTALEESGILACPTCRGPLQQKKQATPPRSVGGLPFEQAAAILCAAMAVLLMYLALGLAGAWIAYVWDVEVNFSWIYPSELPFNDSLMVLIRNQHPEVTDRDWGGVVEWIKESDNPAPVQVVVTSGLTFAAAPHFLNHQDFALTPQTCYGTEMKCLHLKEGAHVEFLHANHMRQSLDVTTWQFAGQAFFGCLSCVALYGAALAATWMCQTRSERGSQ